MAGILKVTNDTRLFTYYLVLHCYSWDDFELIFDITMSKTNAECCEKMDAVWMRQAKLRVDDFYFHLFHHEDIGTIFHHIIKQDSRYYAKLGEMAKLVADFLPDGKIPS